MATTQLPYILDNCLYMDETICGMEFYGYPVAISRNSSELDKLMPYYDKESLQAHLDSLSNDTAKITSNMVNNWGCKLGDTLLKKVKRLRYRRSFLCATKVYDTLQKKLCILLQVQNTSLSPLGPGLCQEQCGITVSKYGDILLDQDLCPGRRDNFTANQAQINS